MWKAMDLCLVLKIWVKILVKIKVNTDAKQSTIEARKTTSKRLIEKSAEKNWWFNW